MSLTVGNIITNRVRVILRDIDEGGIQWLDRELINWYNEAVEEVVRVRPEASSSTEDIQLVAGAKQSLPAGATRLLEVVCNMPNGSEGRVILRADKAVLDIEDRNWMTGTRSDTVIRYANSMTDPRTFYVKPPSLGTTSVAQMRIVVDAPPTPLAFGDDTETAASLSATFGLPTVYAPAIANYILYRAFSKMTGNADAQNRANTFLTIFNQQISASMQSMEQNNAATRDPI